MNLTLSSYSFLEKLKLSGNYCDDYDYSLIDYKKCDSKVIIINKEYNSKHKISPEKLLYGISCSLQNCIDKESLLISKFKNIHGDTYKYDFEYVKFHSKIPIICRYHGIFYQNISSHLNGNGCSECGGSHKLKLNEVLIKFMNAHGDKYSYNKVIYKNMRTKVIIICNKCDEVFHQTPESHKNGNGCPNCSGNKRLTNRKIIKYFEEVHGDTYSYSELNYENSHTKVNVICKKHGSFLISPHNHKYGKGCSKCNMSHGEREVMSFLMDNGIGYEHQYKFTECKNKYHLPFDFFLPDYNTCIEYNGIQHYESVSYFGGDIQLENQRKNDKIKSDYCDNNNIKLMIIKYNENILSKLSSIKAN